MKKKIKIETVNIHGKEYVPVSERLKIAGDRVVAVETDVLRNDENEVMVRAKIVVLGEDGKKETAMVFSGHASSDKKSNGIEGQCSVEVAETSAVGRALGFAGFGVIDGIASADEVIVATKKEKPLYTTGKRSSDDKCSHCGAVSGHKPGCPNA